MDALDPEEAVDMCLTCGCMRLHDDMGNPDNLVIEDLEKSRGEVDSPAWPGEAVKQAMLLPLAGVGLVILYEFLKRPQFFETVFRSRVQTGGGSTSVHFAVYDFIPSILHSHPLFGLGLNNFSIYYEFVTGKTNWGPHSFYVALIVETGVVGTLAFLVFLGYVFWRLRAAIRIGKALAAAGDWVAARVRPPAWGLPAALAGTLASNSLYLTMQFYYFYVFAALAVTVPAVFGRRLTAS